MLYKGGKFPLLPLTPLLLTMLLMLPGSCVIVDKNRENLFSRLSELGVDLATRELGPPPSEDILYTM